jgi:hypothetical protein
VIQAAPVTTQILTAPAATTTIKPTTTIIAPIVK